MKKRIQFLSFLATLAIAIGMISWGSALHAQSTPSTPADRQAQQTPQSPPPQSPDAAPTQQPGTQQTPTPEMPPASQQKPSSDSQTQPPTPPPDAAAPGSGAKASSPTGPGATDSQVFSGAVEKQNDKYVLKDDSGKVYDIDHQDDVKKFEGKRVRVQGTLDPTGTKILVK